MAYNPFHRLQLDLMANFIWISHPRFQRTAHTSSTPATYRMIECSDSSIGKLILETDTLNVQQAVQAKGFDTRPEGGLIEKLKSLARSNFIAFVCNFLGRDGNRAAHALAGLGYSYIEGEALITSTIPDDVFVIVSDDLSAQ
jgi:hypothetical protein